MLSHWDGWLQWSGPKGPKFQIGAPVGIVDGGIGAVTLITKTTDGSANYALTAGHVMGYGTPATIGSRVFCPPRATGSDDYRFGILDSLTQLPRRRLLAKGFRGSTPDFAMIKLENDAMPPAGTEKMMAKGISHSGQYQVAPLGLGDRVFKVAARTPQAQGIVRAVGLYLEARDNISRMAVFADNVVEIGLEPEDFILSGDSGALIYRVSAEGLHDPVAMVIAGSRDGRLGEDKSQRSHTIYALPLTDWVNQSNGAGVSK